MIDMKSTIVPKSDQTNSDDLITGPRTIKITKVSVVEKDQRCIINYENDKGKPYKPCVSMCRVLVMIWGDDGTNYVGQSLTLFLDKTVKWGGVEVGGIRISHMTGLNEKRVMQLTASKGKRKPFCVEPLQIQAAQVEYVNESDISKIQGKLDNLNMGIADFCEKLGIKSIAELPKSRLGIVHKSLKTKETEMNNEA